MIGFRAEGDRAKGYSVRSGDRARVRVWALGLRVQGYNGTKG